MNAELEKYCVQYPRFFFLDKETLIETLSHSADCRKYLKAVRILFKSVHEFIYSLSPTKSKNLEKNKLNTSRAFIKIDEKTLLLSQLDLDINGSHKKFSSLLLIY
jgi:hypothetical protein